MAQHIAIMTGLVLVSSFLLRRIPVFGFLVRLVTRIALVVSPLLLAVALVGLLWHHGGPLLSGGSEAAPRDVAPATYVPLPPRRPRD